MNLVINKLKENKDNNEFIEQFRPYLKDFNAWVKQSNSEEFKKGFVHQKVTFTIKKIKLS